MPNSIKYSTTGDTQSLRDGNFYIGTGDVGKGPTSSTGHWNGITPPGGGYTVYKNKVSNGPAIWTASTDNQLISITNNIEGTSFTSVTQCFTYYANQTDRMVFNRDYEGIITNGLVLNLDAGFLPSYPTSGTTWYDLSYSGNNGTLTNGPTYSAGTITFDGVDDYTNLGNLSYVRTNFSVFAWVNFPTYHTNWRSAAISKWNTGGGDGSNNEWFLGVDNQTGPSPFTCTVQYGAGGSSLIFISDTVNYVTNTWYYIGFTWNSGVLSLYKNGVLVNSATTANTTSRTTTQNVYIASFYTNPPTQYCSNVKISSTQLYSRTLTGTEVLQNFFAVVPIVRNGLVFNLAAGNPISYISGSTTWSDPIGGSRGTLTNGPTFSSSGASSSIVFDGSDDAVIWTSNPLSSLTSAKTYELWVRFDSTIVNTFTISCGTYMVYLENKNTWFINQAGASNSFVSWTFNSGWNHFVYSFDGTNHLCYINGTSRTINFGSGVGSQTNLYIGNRVNMDSPMKGNIAITRMYNRGLNATEILQNFNAQRSVFGL